MKLLTFQARRFGWSPHAPNLPGAVTPEDASGDVEDAVVVFVHAEARDADRERRSKVFKQTLKHVKWLANKRELKTVVLHSFTHLGGDSSEPDFADAFLGELDERLTGTGYRVERTPFGHVCAWNLDVYGESLAKVWKEI